MENIRITKDSKTIEKPTLKQRIITLLKLNNTPGEIALGVAIGVFIAITPLYGFHTIMVIIAAFLIRRLNKIAILLGTNVSTTLTFPFITWAGYNIGRLILQEKYPPLDWSTFKHFDYRQILHLYYPLFIGSLILGLALAALFYFLTLWFITIRRRIKLKQKIDNKNSIKLRVIFVTILFIISLPSFFILKGIDAFEHAEEKIIYAVSPIGRAEYSDEGLVELNNKSVRLITFRTRLIGFDDLEKIYSDPETLLPLKVERFVSILFGKEYLVQDHNLKTNSLVITKFIKNKKVKEYVFKADGPIHNAITLPFYLRSIPEFEIGWNFVARLPEQFTVTLTSIDDVEVPAGKFKAYHFTSSPEKFEIWISKDKYRLPIKIKGLGGYSYTMVMVKHFLKE
jgi:uncharacterized protein (TIGR03546 family)